MPGSAARTATTWSSVLTVLVLLAAPLLTVSPAQAAASSPLKTPSGLKASGLTSTTSTVVWKAVDRATGYQVQYSTSSTMKKPVSSTGAATSRTFVGLKSGSTYYVRVRALSTRVPKPSDYTRTLKIKTLLKDPTPPSTPTPTPSRPTPVPTPTPSPVPTPPPTSVPTPTPTSTPTPVLTPTPTTPAPMEVPTTPAPTEVPTTPAPTEVPTTPTPTEVPTTPAPVPAHPDDAAGLPLLNLPPQPRVLLVGDSYTEGVGAVPLTNGYAYKIAEPLGWTLTQDGKGGSGYVNPTTYGAGTFASRLPGHPADGYELVVLQGSSNDVRYDNTQLDAALSTTLDAVRARFPHARVLLVGPTSPYGNPSADLTRVNAEVKATAAAYDALFVDAIAERWFVPGDGRWAANPSNGHPSNAGHQQIADRLVADVRVLASSPAG